MKIRTHFSEKFRFEIPAEIRRLAALGIIAGLLSIAVSYSRGKDAGTELTQEGAKQKFQQPKDSKQAEGWFIPTPKIAGASEEKQRDIASAFPLPPPRPKTPGSYYELVRAQGDGEEGQYVLVERKCLPNIDMPEPCYLPKRGRGNFPLRRQ